MKILDKLKEMTVVVADTGDIEAIKDHQPQDATTNPSLLLAAAQLAQYKHLVDDAIHFSGMDICDPEQNMRPCLEKLAVNIAREILKVIPGRVSVEVDATLSFDTQATIETARRLIAMFEEQKIDRSRILIKIASTWEGIKAAEQLEQEGIHCNLTLLFSFAQAVACAEAKVQLISPFVGRIMDWHKAQRGVENILAVEDPGVLSVTEIYNYYKKFGYKTEVMGASFRNTGEIIELAGCDLLTISPSLLKELESMSGELPRKLNLEFAKDLTLMKLELNEADFRWMHNQDAMATEKLAEGIRKFSIDLEKLGTLIREQHCS
ncbi:MAG: transaldolase [Candidatus Marinimicrobia bacterium]|nr:transaldolase [Candidatus Neomarinimicrobiota bacterium]